MSREGNYTSEGFEMETMTGQPASGCVNARSLGLWRVGAREYVLGRREDGLALPGVVIGDLDRARRCWHALLVLHSDAEAIIGALESDARAEALLVDWARLTEPRWVGVTP